MVTSGADDVGDSDIVGECGLCSEGSRTEPAASAAAEVEGSGYRKNRSSGLERKHLNLSENIAWGRVDKSG